ncbi:MAG TPA: TatD family hydrolase, partial [Acidobacteriota bacterium]|nr:TatD family hydrolase [Acidobacteriota bacterium]
KPIILHSRGAEGDTIKLVAAHAKVPAILHCFCGSVEQAKEAVAAGMYFSVPVRAVTSKTFQRIIEVVPLSRIFTETDAPYLHYKQERNEPANVTTTILTIAKVKGSVPLEVANQILANYLNVFGKL